MERYSQAGVSIDTGNQFINEIRGLVKKTETPGVLAGIGGFAGLYEVKNYREPVLVSSTDGVGTKILLANQLKIWEGIGIDCVAMSVNDIACYGAKPLFFLDYLAAAKLEIKILKEIVAGIAKACLEIECALLGGETAEMPGIYPAGEFDCAGFAVGILEKSEIIDGKNISVGDAVIGIASSGFHSNGFSLIRKIIADAKITDSVLLKKLLTPTKLYSPLVLKLKKEISIKGIAHITGGGLLENPPRILPAGVGIELREKSWPIPQIMETFRLKGKLSLEEFYRVWNCGIGMVFVIAKKDVGKTLKKIAGWNEKAWLIGKIIEGKKQVTWAKN